MGLKHLLFPDNQEDGRDSEVSSVDQNEENQRDGRRKEIEEELRKYNVFSEPYNKWHDKWMEEFGGLEA